MKVLVTGSTGFIGAHLCSELVARGCTVRAFHRATSKTRLLEGLEVEHCLGDITQPDTLEAAMQGVEIVFHAAAWMGGAEQGGKQYAVTVEGTRSVLLAARQAGVRRLVHTSSVAALGIPEASSGEAVLIDENHTWNYRPDYYPYGYAKYLAELEVQKSVAQGLDAVIVNPTLAFGKGDIYRQSSSIITQVAGKRIPAGIAGGINCVHIADVIDGHLSAMERGRTGERYILGGENLPHMRWLQIIAEVTGAPALNQMLPTRLVRALAWPSHLLRPFLNLPISPELFRLAGLNFFYDTSKARKELQLPEPRPVVDAIREAYQWFTQGAG